MDKSLCWGLFKSLKKIQHAKKIIIMLTKCLAMIFSIIFSSFTRNLVFCMLVLMVGKKKKDGTWFDVSTPESKREFIYIVRFFLMQWKLFHLGTGWIWLKLFYRSPWTMLTHTQVVDSKTPADCLRAFLHPFISSYDQIFLKKILLEVLRVWKANASKNVFSAFDGKTGKWYW